jgi:hypothetical protein
MTYTVQDGDLLSTIAAKFNTDWQSIWWVNRTKISNPNNISAKMVLILPPSGTRATSYILTAASNAIPKSAAPVVTTSSNAPVQQTSNASSVSASGFEGCVIQAESGGDPTAYNASSGASGLFGFLLSTWISAGVGYPGGAYTAPVSVQEQAFAIIYARDGTSPWAPYDGC